ncbi:MAG: ATP-dependent RNA helicase DbpA [Glaciecola sp.]|nr:ATP-dependent RNA helicase DbpA [Glaciecola sp.]MDG1468079.1 ATP-dependent RNA helicase DbpA [Glaciecola sp.]MDG1922872.1 ATP-dependent RNA helicase DbpA [Glaciecola sp.]
MTDFTTLNLRPELIQSVTELGYTQLTDIQAATLPVVLVGEDVLAQAKTGSGKTAAFGLGILQGLDEKRTYTHALVLCPTRELADQVAEQLRLLARRMDNVKITTLCGGIPMNGQIATLRHPPHIIVGTPGRVMDHMLNHRVKLHNLKQFVLDEADRMLDMGFYDELEVIFKHLPKVRQTLMFSATYPDTIAQISDVVQKTPKRIETQSLHSETKIQQIAYKVSDEHRQQAVAAIITHYQAKAAIVFCHTKIQTFELTEYLQQKDISAVALNGDLEQRERTQVLTRFAHKSALVLVATDVAARGLDIDAVDLVINYTVSEEPDVYVHRIGRTGRADAEGLAVTLVSDAEMANLREIEAHAQVVLKPKGIESVRFHANRIIQPEYVTLSIDGGKRQKLRPGDILGSLTKEAGIDGDDIGKINVTNQVSFIAVKLRSVKRAMAQFREGKIKGKKFRARRC